MKKYCIALAKYAPVIILLLLVFGNGTSAQITMSTANCTISANEVQMDIKVTNNGSIDLRWNSCVLRMTVPAAIIPAGTQTYTFNYLGGSDFPLSWPITYPANSFGASYNATSRVLGWTTGNTAAYNNATCSAPIVSPGQTKTIGRFSFKITSSTFVTSAAANFTWHTTSTCNFYQLCAGAVTGYNEGSGLRTLTNPCTLTVPGGPCGAVSATVIQTTAVSACGSSNGTATISLSGLGINEQGSYAIDGGISQPFSGNPFTTTGLNPGNHTILISGSFSSGSCPSVQALFNIGTSSTLTATYSTTKTRVCNSTDFNSGSVSVNPSGGIAPYTYSWTGPNGYTAGNVQTITGLSAGNYHVTITDVNLCVTTIANIQVSSSSLIMITSTTNSTCSNTGIITLQGSEGDAPYTYSLDGTNYQPGNSFSNLTAGSYTGYVRDANGCIGAKSLTIAAALFVTDTGSVLTTCSYSFNGSIILQGNGGVAPYMFRIRSYDPYTTSNTFSNLYNGTYTCYVQDANGCTGSKSITVAISNVSATTTGSVLTTCNNTGSIVLQGNGGVGPYTYSINRGTTYQSSNSFNDLIPGTYFMYVKDATDCGGVVQVTIQQVFDVTATGSVLNACNNSASGVISLQATGGAAPHSYSLDGINYQPGNTFNNLPIGYYLAHVKDANGCIGRKPISITPVMALRISTNENSNPCVNTGYIKILVMGVGVAPYSYSLDGINYQAGNIFNNLGPGNYTIYVKDATGCVVTETSSITGYGPNFYGQTTSSSSCVNNGSIRMKLNTINSEYAVHGPYTFSLDNINFQTSVAFANMAAGSYTIYIKDRYGCVTTRGATVPEIPAPSLTARFTNTSTCVNNGTIQANDPVGGQATFTYSLDGINFQASKSFAGLAAGMYTVTAKDAAGCTATTSVTIGINQLIVSSYVWNVNNCIIPNGKIQLFITGGVNPYSYSLDGINYQPGNMFTGLAGGTYTGYVKDAVGCIGSTSITVSQPGPIGLTARYTNSSTCVNDGTIQADDPVGGQIPFTYSIDGTTFQSGKSFAGLAAGTYTLTVKDAIGCTATAGVTIGLNPINVTSYAWNASSCTATNGKLQLFRTGGVGPYTYSIDGTTYQTSPMFTDLTAGTYTGYVKDSKGCVGTKTGIVVGPGDCPPTFARGNTNNSVDVLDKKIAINVNAYPNPSNSEFTMSLEGFDNKEKILITVTDLLGRVVYQITGTGKSLYRFGNNFKTGMYLLQVMQGNEKKSIKLIKE